MEKILTEAAQCQNTWYDKRPVAMNGVCLGEFQTDEKGIIMTRPFRQNQADYENGKFEDVAESPRST